MASVKIILRNDKLNTKGEAPLYLRIIKDRKTKFISLKIKVKAKDWNILQSKAKKSHPNSQRLNNFLAHKLAEAESIALEMETKDRDIPTRKIKQHILGLGAAHFFDYAEQYLNTLEKSNRYGSYMQAKSSCNKLRKFTGTSEIYFDDIDVRFLKKYEEYLKVELKNARNTIHNNMNFINKMFIEAIREELVPIGKNPFLKIRFKSITTEKFYLTEEALMKLIKYPIEPGSPIEVHKDMYVFACYCGGLRISDVLKLRWQEFDGERLNLMIKKTGKQHCIKVPNKGKEIIEKYHSKDTQPEHYIFPCLNNHINYSDSRSIQQAINKQTQLINETLKVIAKEIGINHKMSFHSSRHTWATRALRKGMRIEYVSKLMGHQSLKQTQIYTKIVQEELDKAMDVFND